ncbi:patatin-like phospholipase family protein [Phenylobacterium sp. LjRoot219]|uniref:patatin-like phospholipase family protein n=1 Tax=Phenylobacterium sp. LjRoot219 TaxID=3342283 RepID=UPI003ECD2336
MRLAASGLARLGGLLGALSLVLAAAGCATPARVPAAPAALAGRAAPSIGQLRFLPARDPAPFVQEARDSIRKELAWRASQGLTGPLPPTSLLAISGGGEDGAYTAGLLNGWTARGDRPEFRAVTGISTGALGAPFAFLGPRYDGVLRTVYTEVSAKDIFRRRNVISGFFGDAMADTTPLFELTSRYIDRPLLDAIAAEYAKGRLLLVGTTNLDTLEPVVWNMTAIAASKDPQAIELFRKVLLASASIPGAFPPVMIDVQVDGKHYQEMHVDGGAMAQVFVYPPALHIREESAARGIERRREIYVIRNARLDADWASVQRRTLSIASRAISSLMQTQGVGDLYRIFLISQRDGVGFNLAYIPSSFTMRRREQFDTAYMRGLYQTGYDLARAGYPWVHTPPGYEEQWRGEAAATSAAAPAKPPAQPQPVGR